MMYERIYLQTPVGRDNEYMILLLPRSVRNLDLHDFEFMEKVLALQMSSVRRMIEDSVTTRWPFPDGSTSAAEQKDKEGKK